MRFKLAIAVLAAAAALCLGTVVTGPASARPVPPRAKCKVHIFVPARTSMNDLAKMFAVSPTRWIGLTFECDGSKLPRLLRAYVSRGDWNRDLPIRVALYPGHPVFGAARSAG